MVDGLRDLLIERATSGSTLTQVADTLTVDDVTAHFCDAYWPAFREIDFLRALRDYAGRQRRFGA
ncbi:undecaprenyl diphosphate synthase family protein [Amycolatopsis sp. NBC_00348]|uniref:undecaprenyl diphosphate synthase family protein n=1 Tax=Amycolatopsis sp. NBC_00348 TaxID=2975956 RepID=UPI002E26236A